MANLPPGLVRVCGKYRLKGYVGSGSFGDVFYGTNVITGDDIAIKLEPADSDNPKLREEWKVYKALGQGIGIPQVSWFGVERGYHAMIMSLLGPSLGQLLEGCEWNFSLKTVLMIGIQVMDHLEYIHNRNFIHRDMKPENLLMGRVGTLSKPLVHLVDFGLATQYRDSESSAHIPLQHRSSLTGTVRYLSINGHRGVESSRRDNLKSLAYVLIYFLRGSLPWQGIEATSRHSKSTLVMKKKLSTTTARLCRNIPNIFATFLDYSRQLSFDSTPDYAYIRAIFEDELISNGDIFDNVFDWSKDCFHSSVALHSDSSEISDVAECSEYKGSPISLLYTGSVWA